MSENKCPCNPCLCTCSHNAIPASTTETEEPPPPRITSLPPFILLLLPRPHELHKPTHKIFLNFTSKIKIVKKQFLCRRVEAKPNSNSLRVDPPSVFFRTTPLLYLFGKPIVSNNKKQEQTTTTKSTTTHMPETQIPEESNCPTSVSYSLPPNLPSKKKNTLKTQTYTKLRTLNCAIR